LEELRLAKRDFAVHTSQTGENFVKGRRGLNESSSASPNAHVKGEDAHGDGAGRPAQGGPAFRVKGWGVKVASVWL